MTSPRRPARLTTADAVFVGLYLAIVVLAYVVIWTQA